MGRFWFATACLAAAAVLLFFAGALLPAALVLILTIVHGGLTYVTYAATKGDRSP